VLFDGGTAVDEGFRAACVVVPLLFVVPLKVAVVDVTASANVVFVLLAVVVDAFLPASIVVVAPVAVLVLDCGGRVAVLVLVSLEVETRVAKLLVVMVAVPFEGKAVVHEAFRAACGAVVVLLPLLLLLLLLRARLKVVVIVVLGNVVFVLDSVVAVKFWPAPAVVAAPGALLVLDRIAVTVLVPLEAGARVVELLVEKDAVLFTTGAVADEAFRANCVVVPLPVEVVVLF